MIRNAEFCLALAELLLEDPSLSSNVQRPIVDDLKKQAHDQATLSGLPIRVYALHLLRPACRRLTEDNVTYLHCRSRPPYPLLQPIDAVMGPEESATDPPKASAQPAATTANSRTAYRRFSTRNHK